MIFVSIQCLSCLMTKPTKWPLRPAKTRIRLGRSESLLSVWSESSLSTLRNSLIRVFTVCIKKYSILLIVDSEDSDQTGWIPRLIWVFAGCTEHLVGFVMRRLIYRTNWYNLTKFWICIDIDKIYIGIAKHQFSLIYNRVMALEWCQDFLSAQYLENELMEFDQVLHVH